MDTALDIVWQKEEWSVLPRSGEDTRKGLPEGLQLFFYYEPPLTIFCPKPPNMRGGRIFFFLLSQLCFCFPVPPEQLDHSFVAQRLLFQPLNVELWKPSVYKIYMSICVHVVWALFMCQSTKNLVHYDLVGELRIEDWPLETRISISSMQFNSKQIKCIFATYLVATFLISFLFFMIIYYSKPQRYCVFRSRSLK